MKSRAARFAEPYAKTLLVPALFLALGAPASAGAERWDDLSRLASPEARAEAAALEARIAGAGSVQEARAAALAETALAEAALALAAPALSEAEEAEARARLAALEARVNEAETAAAVAAEMGALAAPAAHGPAVYAKGGGDCNYSSAETISIVIGLIFGIIPGLIDMWLFC